MDAARTALIVVLVGALLLVLVASAGFALSVRPIRYTSSATPASAFGWTYENFTLQTDDGVRLAAWLVPRSEGPPGQTAVIVLHGYPFSKGNVLGLTQFLHRDHDMLLVDMRSFGESEGAVTTLGFQEWRDVAAAVSFLRARGYRSLGVWGFSMGGAVALLALPHVQGIDAVIADSPYSDLREMTLDYYGRLPVLAGSLAAITDVLSRVFFGVPLADVSPARAVAGSQTPILLIHGRADRTIPVAHHDRILGALSGHPALDAWVIDGADHGYTYASVRDSYEKRVRAFLARYLH